MMEAHSGRTVTLRFEGDDESEVYRLVDHERHLDDDQVSLDSPLGRALDGALPGSCVSYETPSGPLSITVVDVS